MQGKPLLTGGCQCGTVRYAILEEPGRASICHCRMCQKAFGNIGAPLVNVDRAALRWTRGKPSEFRSSVPVARGFCSHCGTPLYMDEEGSENLDLAICTLDTPDAVTPQYQTGVEGEVAWFKILHELPRETTDESRPREELDRLGSLQHPDYDTERRMVKG